MLHWVPPSRAPLLGRGPINSGQTRGEEEDSRLRPAAGVNDGQLVIAAAFRLARTERLTQGGVQRNQRWGLLH